MWMHFPSCRLGTGSVAYIYIYTPKIADWHITVFTALLLFFTCFRVHVFSFLPTRQRPCCIYIYIYMKFENRWLKYCKSSRLQYVIQQRLEALFNQKMLQALKSCRPCEKTYVCIHDKALCSLLCVGVSFIGLFCKRDQVSFAKEPYKREVYMIKCWLRYGVATFSRRLKIIGLFCKRAL